MNFEEVKEVIGIFDKSSLTYIDLKLDNCHICMDKTQSRTKNFNEDSSKDEQAVTVAYDKINNENKDVEVKKEEVKEGRYITSPIVGTFYSSPSPDSDDFVSKGDKVSKGDVLCIIESMKLMNEIESDFGGEIAEILVKDGEVVEYGQNLFRIV